MAQTHVGAKRRVPRVFVSLCPALLALLYPIASRAQRPLNLDFERRSAGDSALPWGWRCECSGAVSLDTTMAHKGRTSVRFANAPGDTSSQWLILDVTSQQFSRHQRLSARIWVRTDADVTREVLVGLGVGRRDGETHDTAKVARSQTWVPVDVALPLDTAVRWVDLWIRFGGRGTAWVDDASLALDGAALETDPASGRVPTESAVMALRRLARPLAAVDDPEAAADLEAIFPSARNPHVIGLGEATHGTSEFERRRQRLIGFLATRRGYSLVAFEADQLEMNRVNDYVTFGRGSASTAIAGLFAVSRTREMVDLIESLRKINRSGKGHVQVAGFDFQHPVLPIDSVIAFLRRFDGPFAVRAESGFADMRADWVAHEYPAFYARRADSVYAQWIAAAQAVKRHMESSRTRYAAEAGGVRASWAIQGANLVLQSAMLSRLRSGQFRDSCMAENILWLLANAPEKTRAVISAHNDHVTRRIGAMGSFLARRLGGEYSPFALTTFQGDYSASRFLPPSSREYLPRQIPPAPADGLESLLHELRMPMMFLDLRAAQGHERPALLDEARPFLDVGWAVMDWPFAPQNPGTYDGIFFVDSTTATHVIPCPSGRVCPG
jgi:erythromycin esterase